MQYYYQPEYMGIWPFPKSEHEIIAEQFIIDYGTFYPELSEKDIIDLSKNLLPIYQDAVKSGLPPFVYDNPATVTTLDHVHTRSGVFRDLALKYLNLLERLVQIGELPTKVWNPGARIKQPGIIEQVTRAGANIMPPATDILSSTLNKFLIFGSITAIAILLGKELISQRR